jgi:sirohydrochlorin ferrochelatase
MASASFDRQIEASPERTGIVLVDHGSRRVASNQMLEGVAAAFERQSRWRIVEPAHMELAEPSIATAFRRCVERGATLVVVFPYLLSPGRHWKEDIPRLAAEAASPYAGVRHVVTEPFGMHPLMLEIVDERIAEALTSGPTQARR